jgi:hypothetical protein
VRRLPLGVCLIGLLTAGPFSTQGCSDALVDCTFQGIEAFLVTVLGPDGNEVCDATVTATGAGKTWTMQVNPGLPDGTCTYIGVAGVAGTFDVTASKPGYLDAHGTTVVHSSGGNCPRYTGPDVTLHLVRAPDAGLPEAGE